MSIKSKVADWFVAVVIVAGVLALAGLLTYNDLIDAEVVHSTRSHK